MTKYNLEFNYVDIERDMHRLTNQLWKLIPMRENEENWMNQLNTVILELVGLSEILYHDEKFIILLSKLEGLRHDTDIDFILYRKTIFETMSLLKEIISYEND